MFTFLAKGAALLLVLYGLFSLYWIATGQFGQAIDMMPEEDGMAWSINSGLAGLVATEISEAMWRIWLGLTLGVLAEVSDRVRAISSRGIGSAHE